MDHAARHPPPRQEPCRHRYRLPQQARRCRANRSRPERRHRECARTHPANSTRKTVGPTPSLRDASAPLLGYQLRNCTKALQWPIRGRSNTAWPGHHVPRAPLRPAHDERPHAAGRATDEGSPRAARPLMGVPLHHSLGVRDGTVLSPVVAESAPTPARPRGRWAGRHVRMGRCKKLFRSVPAYACRVRTAFHRPVDRKRAGNEGQTRRFHWCRRTDLNRGPTDYESVALPLSYVGDGRGHPIPPSRRPRQRKAQAATGRRAVPRPGTPRSRRDRTARCRCARRALRRRDCSSCWCSRRRPACGRRCP